MKNLIFLLIVLCNWQKAYTQNLPKEIIISGTADYLKDGDTVRLIINKYAVQAFGSSFSESVISTVRNHSYKFSFEGKKYPQLILIQFKNHGSEDLSGFVQSGDRLNLDYGHGVLQIGQLMSNSFKVQYDLQNIEANFRKGREHTSFTKDMRKYFCELDTIETLKLTEIEKNRSRLGNIMYEFLQHDVMFGTNDTKYTGLYWFSADQYGTFKEPIISSFKSLYTAFSHREPSISGMDENSITCINYLYDKYQTDSCILKETKLNLIKAIKYFTVHYDGTLREKLITKAICIHQKLTSAELEAVTNSMKFIYNSDYLFFITNTLTSAENAQAYNFKLTDMNGKSVRLSDFKNKVVVLDFWFTGCGNCRKLAPYMVDIEKKLMSKEVIFIGISTDQQITKWKKSVLSGDYVSPSIVNLYTNGKGGNDPIIPHYHVDGYPTIVLISKSGKIVNVKTDPRSDDGHELLTKIKSCIN